MNNILLISEDTIKTESNLNDNVWGKSLLPAIREAQDMGLQPIVGQALYEALCDMVDDGSITADTNTQYKDLLDDYVQMYLVYRVISDCIPIISIKNGNFGAVTSNDEHINNLSEDERERVRAYYEIRADFYCKRMQEFLLDHRTSFPELNECDCHRIEENLHSAASTGLWLGGLFGNKLK